MMEADVHAHLAAPQSIDDVRLPEGAAAVQERRVDMGGAGFELRLRPGAWQRHAPDVIVEVDTGVFHPNGIREAERECPELAPEQRRKMQALRNVSFHVCIKIALIGIGEIENVQRADMHRRFGRFKVEEQGIHPGERFQRVIRSRFSRKWSFVGNIEYVRHVRRRSQRRVS